MNTPMLSQLEEARAPWNWPSTEDEEKEEEFIYFAENIHTGDITEMTEMTEQTYYMLPDTYEEAVRRRYNWAQNDIQVA